MTAAPSAERTVLRARLAAQRLSGPQSADVVQTTRHLLAVQAQDPRAARLSLRPRSTAATAAQIDHALTEERSLIITWVNRGTLHLVATPDEALLHALTTPQLRVTSERRLRQEGVSEAAARRGIRAVVRALGDRGPLARSQLRQVVEAADVPTRGQALVHLLFSATLDGLILRGPMIGRDQAFVLVADWLGPRPNIDRDLALAELARRYLTAHGPADDRDLAKWAQLPLRDARAGLAAIASELIQGQTGMVSLRRTSTAARVPTARLLGPFDPLLLGWRDRRFVLTDPGEVVTSNGVFRAVALIDGRVAGTWALVGGRPKLRLWSEQPPATLAALDREVSAVEEYLRGWAPS